MSVTTLGDPRRVRVALRELDAAIERELAGFMWAVAREARAAAGGIPVDGLWPTRRGRARGKTGTAPDAHSGMR
jgi:hypothetical protein